MEEGEYVIMLHYLLEIYQHHWPISGKSSNLDAIRQEIRHDGNPQVIPRGDFCMVYLESKSLVNSIDSRVDRGGIYQIRRFPKR